MANSSGGIRAGRAFVELYADATQLQADLRNVESKFKALGTMIAGWGTKLSAAGAVVATPLVALSKITASMGQNFLSMSDRTGISVETLSAMDYAASQAGTTIDEFEAGIKNMQKSMVNAADGTKENIEVFEKLGLTVANLRGMKPDDQFLKIADAMGKVKDPSTRAALAMKIFGKSGTELLPMLKEGQGGLRALIQRATELGIVLSTQDAIAAADFNNKLDELWKVVRKAGFDIGTILIPMLTTAANAIERVIVPAMAWLKANKELVVWTAVLAASLLAAGAALFVVGKALAWSMAIMLGAKSAVVMLWNTLWGLVELSGTLAAVIMNPVTLTVAAVVVLGAALLWLSGVGGKVIDWLGARFLELKNFAVKSFQGISDALLAGDIELAAKIVMKSLQVVFETGVNALERVWLGFKFNFLAVWWGIIDGAKTAWISFQNWITQAIIGITASIQTLIAKAMGTYDRAVNGLSNILAHRQIDSQEKSGALTHEQAEMARKAIDDISTGEAGQIDSREQNAIAAEEKAKKDAMAQQQSDTDSHLKEIKDDYYKKLSETPDSGDATTTEELRKLHEELDALLRKAHRERGYASEVMDRVPSPTDAIDGINQAKATSFGTFSARGAAIAGGVQGASAWETAVKTTADNTTDMKVGIDTLVGYGPLVFG